MLVELPGVAATLYKFSVFLGLVLGGLGWIFHSILIGYAWVKGGANWQASATYNSLGEGPLELGVFFAVSLFLIASSAVWLRRAVQDETKDKLSRPSRVKGDSRQSSAPTSLSLGRG